jgi:hypothetical protein
VITSVSLSYRDKVRELEDKPGPRFVTGIVERALAKAKRASADRFAESFRESFRRDVASPPAKLSTRSARVFSCCWASPAMIPPVTPTI